MSITRIAVFGRRNAGKSSLINNVAGQEVAIVSDTAGTTTDPVKKRIEITGIGPVTLIDTAGIDDYGELGEKRVQKTKDEIKQIDAAIVIFTGNLFEATERELVEMLRDNDVPILLIHNKSDLIPLDSSVAIELTEIYGVDLLEYSTKSDNESIEGENQKKLLLSLLAKIVQNSPYTEKGMFEGLVHEGEKIILVCPIDSEAPQGRLILPQVMAIRDLLDREAIAIVQKTESLRSYMEESKEIIKMVVTDSQDFHKVSDIVPASIPLTSFSVLLAKSKGCFEHYLEGTPYISELKDGDKILILESCTHQSSCEDIGRVKIPTMLKRFTGKELSFEVVAGLDAIPESIKDYAMVIQCGGCMITKRQLHNRLKPAIDNGIPVSNYGMTISYVNSIFNRAVAIFKEKEYVG